MPRGRSQSIERFPFSSFPSIDAPLPCMRVRMAIPQAANIALYLLPIQEAGRIRMYYICSSVYVREFYDNFLNLLERHVLEVHVSSFLHLSYVLQLRYSPLRIYVNVQFKFKCPYFFYLLSHFWRWKKRKMQKALSQQSYGRNVWNDIFALQPSYLIIGGVRVEAND